MLNSKTISKNARQRSRRGALLAENAGVLYMLFMLLFFPLLDMAVVGIRAFFLWYACNQAAMAGSKGTKWSTGNVSSGGNYALSIQTQASAAAAQVANNFSGITINSGYPQYTVILRAIQHSDTTSNQASASTITYTNGSGLPLTVPVDTSQYVPILRVQIVGVVKPFIPVPFFFSVPGLNAPFTLSILTDQQIEDAQALSS